MKKRILTVLLTIAGIIFSGCHYSKENFTEQINLSEGISIVVTHDGTVIIESNVVPVNKVLEQLEKLKAKTSDVIVITVSPRASQRPVLQILDQLGDAKYNNITITSGSGE